jgi:membrane fusion protein, multidrug efflux system
MHRYIRIIVECVLVIVLGVAGLGIMTMLRRPPAVEAPVEKPVRVEIITAAPEDSAVIITGYGTARSRDIVSIMPEVTGNVTELHPTLEVGAVIPEGELLFAIEPLLYEARVSAARAQIDQIKSGIGLLKIQQETDRERLTIVERSVELARAEFERLKNLFEQDKVGARAQVEKAEQAYNEARDTLARMQQNLRLYPGRIKEMESTLAAAHAEYDQTEYSLARTRVHAPFDARVKMKQIELNQYVAPGAPVLALADDSQLEISVPLDSREARNWLLFEEKEDSGTRADAAWFEKVEQVPCRIQWTEDNSRFWTGRLARIESFDEMTRTLTVAVRIAAAQARSGAGNGKLPLVDGMFCEVHIPGREMKDVFKLPRSAVTFEGTVYIAENDRLRTAPVELVHEHGQHAFVRGGIAPGSRVVVTRLVNPRENMLLEATPAGTAEESDS